MSIDRERAEVENNILEVRDARVTFDMTRGQSNVLNDVSIDVERGEVLGVVGESGSGKSMFASALLDAVEDPGKLSGDITYYPESGEPVDILSLDSEELRQFRWEKISMVFQGAMSSFNPVMKIRTHFIETLDAHGMERSEGMNRAKDLLSQLYLDPERVLGSYPHELSGGMQQRALIALSLVLDPDVLVMDEPTAALDLLMQRSIISLLKKVQEALDLTLIFITHDLPLVSHMSDRIAVLYAFEFVEIGPTNKIILNGAHPYTRALIRATPNLDVSSEDISTVKGESPDPVNIPNGCAYHPRCPLADEQCEIEVPQLEEVNRDHRAACFHHEQASDAVPLKITSEDGGSQQ